MYCGSCIYIGNCFGDCCVEGQEFPTNNTLIAMRILGWQGGTIHQVARATGLTIEQILEADDIRALMKEALKKRGTT